MTAGKRTTAGTTFGQPGRSARVTCQFYDKERKVYEIDCDETRVSLTMSAAPAKGEKWEIEAAVNEGITRNVLRAFGLSRDEALRAVGHAWDEFGGLEGYRQLNWLAIHEALTAVRGV